MGDAFRDSLIRTTANFISCLFGAFGIAIVGGTAYFFMRLLFRCKP